MASHDNNHLVSKLYVEPSAYATFVKSGVWPEKTTIVLELRSAKIARRTRGKCDLVGLEAAVKNHSELSDPWSYYGIVYDKDGVDEPIPTETACEDCPNPPVDLTLATYFPTLKAVIDAKPSAMRSNLF